MRFLALLAAGLMACAAPRPAPPSAPGPASDPWASLKVEDAPFRGNWVQTLVVERGGRALELLAVIETDGSRLTLVGLNPAGQRLLRITWAEGKVEQETHPGIPARIDGESILRDFVFAHWPAAALESALAPGGWETRIDGSRRVLSRQGRAYLEVSPGPDGALRIQHPRERYEIRVITVERNAP